MMGAVRAIRAAVRRAAAAVLVFLVRAYQVTLSPLVGRRCRFDPTCSNYFLQAIRKYGPWRGAAKGLWRICRCHPWGGYGHDPP
jgi:putative membrane protein insertion efficiency factor